MRNKNKNLRSYLIKSIRLSTKRFKEYVTLKSLMIIIEIKSMEFMAFRKVLYYFIWLLPIMQLFLIFYIIGVNI